MEESGNEKKVWSVSAEEAGQKLALFLQKQLGDSFSLRAVKKQIESGRCQINQRVETFASVRIWEKDEVVLQLSLQEHKQRILWEDENLLLFDKPPHLLSEPEGIVQTLASHHPHLILVHRLDRETTGVILLAKNGVIKDRLIEQFRHFSVNKNYLALVQGRVDQAEGKAESYLERGSPSSLGPVWKESRNSKGLYAYTAWARLESNPAATLLRCCPKTGRTHQIRVHLAGMGHPIIGDRRYGCLHRQYSWAPRFFLHAESLEFVHPMTQQTICVRAPLPEDFRQAMQRLDLCFRVF